jgi:hypothetical protein
MQKAHCIYSALLLRVNTRTFHQKWWKVFCLRHKSFKVGEIQYLSTNHAASPLPVLCIARVLERPSLIKKVQEMPTRVVAIA